MLCSATLELSQDDIDGGRLSSAVFIRGDASDGQIVLGEDYLEQDLEQSVGVSIGEATHRHWEYSFTLLS